MLLNVDDDDDDDNNDDNIDNEDHGHNRSSYDVVEAVVYGWFSLTWQGGHIGGPNNTICLDRICKKYNLVPYATVMSPENDVLGMLFPPHGFGSEDKTWGGILRLPT